MISLRDEVRTEAPDVLKQLRANGIRRIVMLTGDHPDIAKVVAAELGIDEWRAEVMPEDKLEVVRQLQDEGYIVGMVGDGINDAPALAAANIGIAMGLAGTDVAVETADVALANDDLRRLLDVGDLGTRAVEVIRQNYGMSIAVNAAGLLIGAGGALSPGTRSDPAQRVVGGRCREQFTFDSVSLGLKASARSDVGLVRCAQPAKGSSVERRPSCHRPRSTPLPANGSRTPTRSSPPTCPSTNSLSCTGPVSNHSTW